MRPSLHLAVAHPGEGPFRARNASRRCAPSSTRPPTWPTCASRSPIAFAITPAQNTNELDERRQRLTAGNDRLKQLVDFIASGHRSNAVGDEIRLLETQNAADVAAIERLERHAREATKPLALLPSPDEITARAFDVHRLLDGDLDRSRLHLTRWLEDGQIRVRRSPAGFGLQGTCYPLLIFRSAENKKPKSGELLGESENVLLGSGGGI